MSQGTLLLLYVIRFLTWANGLCARVTIAIQVRIQRLERIDVKSSVWWCPKNDSATVAAGLAKLAEVDPRLYEKYERIAMTCVWTRGDSYRFPHSRLFGCGSDCHAWSAEGIAVFIVYHYFLTVGCLEDGVKSYGPGFARVSEEAHRAAFQWMQEHNSHPRLIEAFRIY
jgi:hypothetical protein